MSDRPITGSFKDAAAAKGIPATKKGFRAPSESRLDERNKLPLVPTPDVTGEYKLLKTERTSLRFADLPENTPRACAEFLRDRIENLKNRVVFFANQSSPQVFDTDMAQSALDMLESILEPRPETKSDRLTHDRAIALNPVIDTALRTGEYWVSSQGPILQAKADESLAKKLAIEPQELPSKRTFTNEPWASSARTNERADQALVEELAGGPQRFPSKRIMNEQPQQEQTQIVASSSTPIQSLRTLSSRMEARPPLQSLATDDHSKCMKKIDKQLRELNSKLKWRVEETREAYECFKKLMVEYNELKARNDILLKYHEEDTAALEGLHGTLAAFQDSIDNWMKRHSSAAENRQSAVDRLIEQRELESRSLDTLSDDIQGFMNGWNDAKVEFYSRRDSRRRPESIRRKPLLATSSTNAKMDVKNR
ncbi:hypothetical protein BJX63DRAFT_290856 [Aspergillus granulosus]|uniref:Uncharacterized protein n=1 Tax=Aspergillus granulosus TaxID=176169 RepID=A0ABR4H6R3_9EURO